MSATSGASDVVTAFMQAMERRDLDAAGAFVTDDLVYHNIPMQPIHGRDAMVAALAPFLAGSLTVEWVVHHQTATGVWLRTASSASTFALRCNKMVWQATN